MITSLHLIARMSNNAIITERFSTLLNSQIVHNYGHGGSGVSVSPGTSIHAVQLFGDLHRASGSCKL